MNVCLISREYPPFVGGGIGTYTTQYARALAERGHRAVVVTVSRTGREERQERAGVTVVRVPFVRGDDWSGPDPAIRTAETIAAFRRLPVSVFAMQAARAVPGLHAEFGFDAIEAPDTGALAWSLLRERPAGLPPVMVCVHSPTAWIEETNGASNSGSARQVRTLIRMERDVATWCDGLVCPSGWMARRAEGLWSLAAGSIEVIPYALGDIEARARAASTGASAGGAGRVLYAGRLEPRKGIATLLEGFVHACEAGADVELELAGQDTRDGASGGPHGAGLIERLVPGALRERVRLLGQLDPASLAARRAAAAIVAVPSPIDNYPFTCIEAMADGRVVVAARAGGMAEMIRDGVDGVLFEPGDAVSCGAALARAAGMDEGARARMGRSGAGRILSLCGNEEIVRRRAAHTAGLTVRAAPARRGVLGLLLGSIRGARMAGDYDRGASARSGR